MVGSCSQVDLLNRYPYYVQYCRPVTVTHAANSRSVSLARTRKTPYQHRNTRISRQRARTAKRRRTDERPDETQHIRLRIAHAASAATCSRAQARTQVWTKHASKRNRRTRCATAARACSGHLLSHTRSSHTDRSGNAPETNRSAGSCAYFQSRLRSYFRQSGTRGNELCTAERTSLSIISYRMPPSRCPRSLRQHLRRRRQRLWRRRWRRLRRRLYGRLG